MGTLVVNMQRSSVVALLFVLNLASWLILLGGVAAWQYQCDHGDGATDIDLSSPPPPPGGRRLLATITIPLDTACGTAYVGLNWWALFFQLFVLVFIFATYFSKGYTSYKGSLMTVMAMVTTLMFITTNNTFTVIKNSSGNSKAAAQATAAGFIITMIANMIIILIVGGDPSDGSEGSFVPFTGPASGEGVGRSAPHPPRTTSMMGGGGDVQMHMQQSSYQP